MKTPRNAHIKSVLSEPMAWTSIATHCDLPSLELEAAVHDLVRDRQSFVCAALPRARYAQGGFALLTEPQQRLTLTDPTQNLAVLDAPLTAWALPYEWLAARAAQAAGLCTPRRASRPALGQHFATLTQVPGTQPNPQTPQPYSQAISGERAPSAYRRALATIRDAIAGGHVYQVNLTQSQSRRGTREQVLRLWFDALLEFRPAFAYLWHDRERLIACLSPEELWSCDGSTLLTAPIKGTVLDDSRELSSDKNRAEHTMIVDLERNDLHRICQPGTVQVPILAAPTAYGGVEHLVSLVRGQIQPGMGLSQILDALAPGGSITGAPKLAAIEYIQRLEAQPRGIYCGALALTLDTQPYRGFAALPIRTAEWRHGWMRYGSGGGITIDSDADMEYRELLRKQYWLKDFGHG